MNQFAEPDAASQATGARRIAIYGAGVDSRLRANQRTAIRRYVDAMGWVVVAVIENDPEQLAAAARTSTIDLVVCWRHSDVEAAEGLSEILQAGGIELLALAQSCSALLE